MTPPDSILDTLPVHRVTQIVLYGRPIAQSRAEHIIIRTDRFWSHWRDNRRQFYTSMTPYDELVYQMCGLPYGFLQLAEPGVIQYYNRIYNNFIKSIGYVDTRHLINEYISTYEPAGWVSPQGNLKYNGLAYTWVNPRSLYQECVIIAENFKDLEFDVAVKAYTNDDMNHFDDIDVIFKVTNGSVDIALNNEYEFATRFGASVDMLTDCYSQYDLHQKHLINVEKIVLTDIDSLERMIVDTINDLHRV